MAIRRPSGWGSRATPPERRQRTTRARSSPAVPPSRPTALEKIEAVRQEAGVNLEAVSRMRLIVTEMDGWDAIGWADAEVFVDIPPAMGMLEVSGLIDSGVGIEIPAVGILAE